MLEFYLKICINYYVNVNFIVYNLCWLDFIYNLVLICYSEYVKESKMLYVVMEKGDTDLSKLIRDICKTTKISMSMIIYYWTEMLTVVRDIHNKGNYLVIYFWWNSKITNSFSFYIILKFIDKFSISL